MQVFWKVLNFRRIIVNQCNATDWACSEEIKQKRQHSASLCLEKSAKMLQCSITKLLKQFHNSWHNSSGQARKGKSPTSRAPETFMIQTLCLLLTSLTSELTFIAPLHCSRLLRPVITEVRVPVGTAVNHPSIVSPVVEPPQVSKAASASSLSSCCSVLWGKPETVDCHDSLLGSEDDGC